jgi:hypothetical protein
LGTIKSISKVSSIVVAAQFTLFMSVALATTTFVSKSGNDGNSCGSPLTPCLTINGALSQAISGGGGFNRVSIIGNGIFSEVVSLTSAAEIIGDAGSYQGIAPGANNTAITINDGGAGSSFRIRNLQLLGSSGAAANGIAVSNAGQLDIQNVTIHGFGGTAISYTPAATYQYSSMSLSNSAIEQGAGVLIMPSGNALPHVDIANTSIRDCSKYCLRADSTAMSGGGINLLVKDSTLHNAATSNLATTSGSTAFIQVILNNTSVTQSASGVVSNGSNTTVVLDHATVAYNTTGVYAYNGGIIDTYGNNDIVSNSTNVSGSLTPISFK